MNMKIVSLMAGLVLVAGMGVAQAEEQLSAAQMDVVTAAGYKKGKHFKVRPQTLAVAEALADCYGSAKCFTDTSAIAIVTKNSATSVSFALASTGGYK
jgi:hypothetical protein